MRFFAFNNYKYTAKIINCKLKLSDENCPPEMIKFNSNRVSARFFAPAYQTSFLSNKKAVLKFLRTAFLKRVTDLLRSYGKRYFFHYLFNIIYRIIRGDKYRFISTWFSVRITMNCKDRGGNTFN